MSRPLEFDIEWEAISGTRGEENRATWARFGLSVDGQPITRVLDHRAKSYRDHILIPLYPVTEWIVTHWWMLFYEPESPGRKGFESRHNLRFGREGYAFPELRFRPVGDWVVVEWNPLDVAGSVSFPSSGAVRIERDALQEALTGWVELVVARLEQQGISHTLLQDEWAAVQATDADERAFCVAAAQLGQDPYILSDTLAEGIVQAGSVLPLEWRDEFFSAVGVEQLAVQVEYALRARDAIHGYPGDLGALTALRGKAEKLDPRRAPWVQGYEVARWLRREVGADHQPVATDEALARLLGVGELPLVDPSIVPPSRWIDAVVESDGNGRGGFVTATQRPENRRFAFCRALFEYLTDIGAPSALITVARTERQKRNRAFAAELLAPADWLRNRWSGELVGPEDIEDAAEALGVSSEVVHRQLENHRIARLVD